MLQLTMAWIKMVPDRALLAMKVMEKLVFVEGSLSKATNSRNNMQCFEKINDLDVWQKMNFI